VPDPQASLYPTAQSPSQDVLPFQDVKKKKKDTIHALASMPFPRCAEPSWAGLAGRVSVRVAGLQSGVGVGADEVLGTRVTGPRALLVPGVGLIEIVDTTAGDEQAVDDGVLVAAITRDVGRGGVACRALDAGHHLSVCLGSRSHQSTGWHPQTCSQSQQGSHLVTLGVTTILIRLTSARISFHVLLKVLMLHLLFQS